VFVFDSHRPLDLENTRGDNRDVLVLRDEREGEETFPEPDSDFGDSDDSDDDENDDENANDNDASDDEASDSEKENTPDDDTDASKKKRKRDGGTNHVKETPSTRKARRHQKQLERVAYYSRGSFYGRPAGLVMYDIAHDAHKDSLEKHFPLWLAIVSLTDQYVHQRLSHEAYTSGVMELATQVSNLPDADAPTEKVLDDQITVKAFEDRKVSYAEEFRFSMLRHWSLYDAMTHSPYVATRLQTWREAGRASLHSLLAHLGLPLEACKQQYTHMSPEHVQQLHSKLEQHGPSHGLDDLKFWSFSFGHGFKMKLPATDVVHGVTALLEGVPSASGSDDLETGEGGVGGAHNFWRAVKALGMSQYDEMQVGLRHAMRSQRALMRQGGLALANKAVIRTVGGLRYFSLLDHGSPSDAALFKHPLALLRLALFLQDALRVVKKITRPLVVVGPSAMDTGDAGSNPTSGGGLALVVGVTGKPRADDLESGNHFSRSFRLAAEQVRAEFKHDSFEASVLQVSTPNLGEFMEALSDIDAERVARERMRAA
jgi:cell division control protein 45